MNYFLIFVFVVELVFVLGLLAWAVGGSLKEFLGKRRANRDAAEWVRTHGANLIERVLPPRPEPMGRTDAGLAPGDDGHDHRRGGDRPR